MRWQLSFLFLCLAIARTEAQYDLTDENDIAPSEYLREWMASFVFSIPDQHLSVKSFSVDITNLVCTGMNLTALNSSYIPPTTLSASVTGLAISCNCLWAYEEEKFPHWPSGHGSAAVTVADSTFAMDLELIQRDGLAVAVETHNCVSAIRVQDIDFQGGLTGALLKLFKPQIMNAMNNGISKVLCSQLEEVVRKNGTEALLKVDRIVEPFLQPVAPVPPPPMPVDSSSLVSFVGMEQTAELIAQLLLGPGGCLSINTIIDTFLGPEISMLVGQNISFSVPNIADVTVGVVDFDLIGLDTFEDFRVIGLAPPGPAANQTISTSVRLGSLSFASNVFFRVNITSPILGSTMLFEQGKLTGKLSEVHLFVDTLLAFRRHELSRLRLSQLTDLDCLIPAIFAANITRMGLNVTVDELSIEPVNAGDLEAEVDQVIDNVFALLVNGFKSTITNLVLGVVGGPMRDTFNTLLASLLVPFLPCTVPPPSPPNMLNFTDNPTLNFMQMFINTAFSTPGPFYLNSIIDCVTGMLGTPGSVIVPQKLVNFDMNDSQFGEIHVDVRDLGVSGMGSFSNLSLLNYVSDYALSHSLAIGSCWDGETCNPTNLSLTTDLLYRTKQQKINETFTLQTSASNIAVGFGTVLEVNMAAFQDLTIANLSNVHCLMTALVAARLENFTLSFGSFNLALKGGPMFQAVEALLLKMGDLAPMMNPFLAGMSKPATDMLNPFIAGQISDAPLICAGADPSSLHPKPKKESHEAVAIGVLAGGGGGLLLLGLGICFFRRRHRNQRKYSLNKPLIEDDEVVFSSLGTDTVRKSVLVSEHMPALVCHPAINPLVRMLVPVIIVLDMGLFLWSHTSRGADVTLRLSTGETQTLQLPPLFTFSLGNSIRDMWEAEVYPLSLLIAVFSGGWPYLKLLMMLACWTMPVRWFPLKHRQRCLMWLDALGKWSLIDAYVLIMMMVAFRFHMGVDALAADVVVVPGWGIYGFILAAIISLAFSHIILAYHRHVTGQDRIPAGGSKVALRTHEFRCGSRSFRFGKFGQSGVLLFTFVVMVLVVVGAVVYSFRFVFHGAAGWALGDHNSQDYSLISVGRVLPDSSGTPNNFGVRWLQIMYFLMSLVAPLAQLLILAILWYTPLTRLAQRRFVIAAEVLNAWAGLDVFVVSIVASVVEIQQFAQFIVGEKCDPINPLIAAFLGDKLHGYNTCFDVQATLAGGCWFLFAAALFSIAVAQLMMHGGEQMLEARAKELEMSGESSSNDQTVTQA